MNHRRRSNNNQRDAHNYVYNPVDDYMTLYNAFVTYDDQCNSEFIRHNNNTEPIARLERLNVYIDNITYYITTTINSQIFKTLDNNMKSDLLEVYKNGKFRRHVINVQNYGPSFFRHEGNDESDLALTIINKYRSLNRLLDNPTTTSINHMTGFGQRFPSSYYYY